jgi:hypothetical protein
LFPHKKKKVNKKFANSKISRTFAVPKTEVERFGLLATTQKNAKLHFHISVLCFLASAFCSGLIFFV